MSREVAALIIAILSSTSPTPVRSQTTTETSSSTGTTQSSTITSTDTTSSQTTTTVPGPFLVSQSVVLLSNGTQEEVEALVLGALASVLAETSRELDVEFVPQGPQVQCVDDAQCPAGNTCGVDSGICLPRYELRTSGSCSIHVRTMHECEAAAVALGLPDTSATPDRQGVRFVPPFCYIELGFLYYNQGGSNSGSCVHGVQCVCATSSRALLHGNLTVVTTSIELRSSGGQEIGGLLGNARENALESLQELGFRASESLFVLGDLLRGGLPRGRIRRLSSSGLGAWRVDAEVIAHDRFTSEQLSYALGNPASFSVAIQAQDEYSSLQFVDFLLSEPAVRRPTETMTETQTTTATTATATTTTTGTTASATATTTTAAVMGQPVPPVEDSTALIVTLTVLATLLLASASVAAGVVFKRRKNANNVQHAIDWDMEGGTATQNSKYSSNVIEI